MRCNLTRMRIRMKIVIALIGCLCCLVSCKQKPDVVFYNANIVDVEQGKISPGMTVSVKDGIILKIEKSGTRIRAGEKA